MNKFLANLLLIVFAVAASSCRMPTNFGFYQPITLDLTTPDGPPEYKAGWYAGCRTALGVKGFANAWVYQTSKGPDMGSGVYQHDPAYQTGWGQGWFACVLHTGDFVEFNSMRDGPLQ